jgi:acetylornithine deacetylase/succinyl-diaminopimelate desuccinylase-like protein
VSTKYPSVNLAPGHGAAHQPDEALSIEGLLEALEITVKMLIECDKIKE